MVRRLFCRVVGERGFLAAHALLERLGSLSAGGGPRRATPGFRRDRATFGVNIAGSVVSEGGVAEGARGIIRAAQAGAIPHVVNRFDIGVPRYADRALEHRASRDNPYGVNLVHLNPNQVPRFFRAMGRDYAAGRYNVGFWAWELAAFPRRWLDRFAYFDEIWTPSTFCREALEAVAPVPVRVVPHPIASGNGGAPARRRFGLPDDRFVFLFMFDFYSVFERKNPLAVVEAFQRAFAPAEPVLLVLKFYNAEINPAGHARLREAARRPNVRLLDGWMPQETLRVLLACCDAYVSLHRAEGFGLTLAEAMALGKPVIATDYSGNRDFMTPENSFLVRARLTALARSYGAYEKGQVWAEPEVDDAARWMRYVFAHREAARQVGRRAAADIRARLAPAAVGSLIRSELRRIFQESEPVAGSAGGPGEPCGEAGR
ncbi:glycosyltransferase family 4 protein [Nitrospira sp. Kam-Ns4a]